MSTDSAGVTDELVAQLNAATGVTPADPGEQLPGLPERPGDDDSRAAWVDYVVALGADRGMLEGQAPYTGWDRVDDVGLRELADRLGG